MVRFIYGDTGTGKTEYIFSALADDAKTGKRAFLIVPEQMTVSAERDLLMRLPASAQLHIEVLNFSRLSNRIFRERGGLVYNYATPGVRRLFMWCALRETAPLLREYGERAGDDKTLPAAMLNTVKELNANGITGEQLEEVAGLVSDARLSGKLKDLSAASSVYSTLLGAQFTDSENDISRMCDIIRESPYFNGANVYFDAFTSLTGREHEAVRLIMEQADNVTVSLGIPSPLSRSIDTVSLRGCSDRLRSDAASVGAKVETLTLDKNHRTENEALKLIASSFWKMESARGAVINEKDSDGIELLRAADIYDEAESCAARIRRLAESGMKYRDILVVARNASKYRGILEPAFEVQDIPFFFSEKTELAFSPLSRLILSALRIFIFGWKQDDVIAHLKTGLCGIDPLDADLFETYVDKWKISGKRFTDASPWTMNADGFTERKSKRGLSILESANTVRDRLVGNLKTLYSSLEAAEDITGMCCAVMGYLERISVAETLRQAAARELAAGHVREAGEDVRVYDAVTDALEKVCDVFRDSASKPDLRTFSTALSMMLESTELGTIPTSSDEVTVASANMLRADSPACVIILGACDGEFPSNSEGNGLLTDADREILDSFKLKLAGSAEERSSDELYYFRRAASAPSEKLIVFTRADSTPSVAFNRFFTLFPELRDKVRNTADCLFDRLRTPASAYEYASLLSDTSEGDAIRLALSRLPAGDPHRVSETVRFPFKADGDMIDPELARTVFGSSIDLSKSQINSYVGCPFSYCLKYILKLDENEKAEFSSADVGTFIHYVLEKYLYEVFVVRGGKVPGEEETLAIVDKITASFMDSFIPEDSDVLTPRLKHRFERLKVFALEVLKDIVFELSDGDFVPEFFEYKIGKGNSPSMSVELSDGTEVRINGTIDRVDTFRKDGKVYVRVIDYKTGAQKFSIKNIKNGTDLQLLLYIFSLTKNGDGSFAGTAGGKPEAAEIMYFSTKIDNDKISDVNDAPFTRSGLILDDPDVKYAASHASSPYILMKTVKTNSFISAEAMEGLYRETSDALGTIAQNMVDGKACSVPEKSLDPCRFCRYESICHSAKKNYF